MDVKYAGHPLCLPSSCVSRGGSMQSPDRQHLIFHHWLLLKVPMCQRDSVKDNTEEKPRDHEAGAEYKQQVSPADVHAGGEDVSQVALPLFLHVGEYNITLPIFLYKTAPHLVGAPCQNLAVVVVHPSLYPCAGHCSRGSGPPTSIFGAFLDRRVRLEVGRAVAVM